MQDTFLKYAFKFSLGRVHRTTASQNSSKSAPTPAGFVSINLQIPKKADSFSRLSLIFARLVHQALKKCGIAGAISAGQIKPSRPMVIAAFSCKAFRERRSLFKSGTRRCIKRGTKGLISSPGLKRPYATARQSHRHSMQHCYRHCWHLARHLDRSEQ